MKSELTSNKLNLYRDLLRIRLVEEAIVARYSERPSDALIRCPVHLSIGQEAIAVGVCSQLAKQDCVISGHRAHAHYLAKGGDLKAMLAGIYGKKKGCALGRGGSMHLVDLNVGFIGSTPIVGGSIPIGVGVAFAAHLKKEDHVTVIFFGEGATEEGVFFESMNFAALKKLAVLFVCENNFYSVYSPLSLRQPPKRNLPNLARAHGLIAFEGDGNNIDEVVNLTQTAVNHLKNGEGPCFLELTTYRFREHCGPQLDVYQPKDEVAFWKKKDPVTAILHLIPEVILETIRSEIEEAFVFAENEPFPEVMSERD